MKNVLTACVMMFMLFAGRIAEAQQIEIYTPVPPGAIRLASNSEFPGFADEATVTGNGMNGTRICLTTWQSPGVVRLVNLSPQPVQSSFERGKWKPSEVSPCGHEGRGTKPAGNSFWMKPYETATWKVE